MNGKEKITLDTVKQNTAFRNIRAFLECNSKGISERLLNEYLTDITRMVKTYYAKYDVNLDDIIAESFFAFAVRVGEYPNTTRFESYTRENVCKYIRRHIIKYCESEIKTETLEKQKQERYVKYIIKA